MANVLTYTKELATYLYLRLKGVTHVGKGLSIYVGFCVFHGGKNITLGSNICLADSLLNAGDTAGSITIEANCFFGHRVMVLARGHDYKLTGTDRARTIIEKPIVIRTGAWIGSGSIILPGVEIGANSVVGAGSVVTKNVAPNSVVGGVPARFIKTID
jgi:acetyltransferase-like isoleucine patch superfamily enzyme